MKLSQREKYIAMGVGAAIALFVLEQVVIEPYSDSLTTVNKQIAAGVEQQKENKAIFDKQSRLNPIWTAITSELKSDESAAETQALTASLGWAQDAGVNITAVKPERITVVNDFEVIGFHLTGNGSTPAMAKMMKAFETANIPVRVDEMTLSPVREGTDNLKVELTLSTLCLKPQADEPAKTTVSDAHGISEVQPWNE